MKMLKTSSHRGHREHREERNEKNIFIDVFFSVPSTFSVRTSFVVAALFAVQASIYAQEESRSLLDQALEENKPAEKKADEKKPENRPAAPRISPDAARQVDQDDLTRKLTGEEKPPGGSGPDMQAIVSRMGQSTQRLKQEDTSDVTQEIQRRIVLDIDTLIEAAKKQQGGGQGQQQQKPQDAQKRQANPGQGQQGQHQDAGNQAAKASELPGGGVSAAQSNGQDIRQKSSEWGNLPPRERDLIVNGSKEEALPSYKELVQRYYQALSELNRTQREER